MPKFDRTHCTGQFTPKMKTKSGSAFAFIFGVNWLWRCGITTSFSIFLDSDKHRNLTWLRNLVTNKHQIPRYQGNKRQERNKITDQKYIYKQNLAASVFLFDLPRLYILGCSQEHLGFDRTERGKQKNNRSMTDIFA